MAGQTIVQHNAGTRRKSGNIPHRRPKRRERKVRNYPKPAELRGPHGIEPCREKLRRKRLLRFEVNRYKGKGVRHGNLVRVEEFPLPLLRCRVIHLEHAQPGVPVSIRERVKAGPEENVLRDALRNRAGQRVFGKAAAGYKKTSQGD